MFLEAQIEVLHEHVEVCSVSNSEVVREFLRLGI